MPASRFILLLSVIAAALLFGSCALCFMQLGADVAEALAIASLLLFPAGLVVFFLRVLLGSILRALRWRSKQRASMVLVAGYWVAAVLATLWCWASAGQASAAHLLAAGAAYLFVLLAVHAQPRMRRRRYVPY